MSGRPHPLYASPPRPCPYLDGRIERTIAAELTGVGVGKLYQDALRAGFRRSHNIVYRPACPGCNACKPVRIITGQFQTSRSLDRVLRQNHDLTAMSSLPQANTEQYGLFARYQSTRHPGGGMDRMSFMEFSAMTEESPVSTFVAEFRTPDRELVAVMLIDELDDGLSAVYSFFDPQQSKRALGTYMILWLVEECQRREKPYLYLGYWIEGCDKMDYKARFQPLETLASNGWEPLVTKARETV